MKDLQRDIHTTYLGKNGLESMQFSFSIICVMKMTTEGKKQMSGFTLQLSRNQVCLLEGEVLRKRRKTSPNRLP
jgi:hypothetical protein